MNVPEIPDSAPFTPEQRKWLEGYINGLVAAIKAGVPATAGAAPATNGATTAKKPILLLYGSQSGNAQGLAEGFVEDLRGLKIESRAIDLEDADPHDLAKEESVLVVTSTWGEGDPPDTAVEFWNKLSADDQPPLKDLQFSVLALGDTNYADFCEFGKRVDARFEKLGAKRMAPRVDCDVDFEEPAKEWFGAVATALQSMNGSDKDPPAESSTATAEPAAPAATAEPEPYGKKNPFPSKLLVNRRLNKDESPRDTRHYELSLDGSGLEYECGDSLAVHPVNDPALVDEVIKALPFKTDIQIREQASGDKVAFRDALLHDYDLRTVNKKIVTEWAAAFLSILTCAPLSSPRMQGGDEQLHLGPRNRRPCRRLSGGVQEGGRGIHQAPAQARRLAFTRLLPARKPHPGEVHLTIATVVYEVPRTGPKRSVFDFSSPSVIPVGEKPCKVFVHKAKGFKLPEDTDRDVIMVGPGTGIAPFRAFLEERAITGGGKGRNWLLFGNPHEATDYFYQEEFEQMQKDGVLNKLDLAWSRDQDYKIYVQHKLQENAETLWNWIEGGAHFYVCGDATRMAKDVDQALHDADRQVWQEVRRRSQGLRRADEEGQALPAGRVLGHCCSLATGLVFVSPSDFESSAAVDSSAPF